MSNESKGVSNCYVFKSRLQEYAQKVGFSTPVYETIKEGPSHQPFFRSTVVVNEVRYDSLIGFSNRKAAEQSAAEIALMELVKSGDMKECISQPVHETGLCKNLLQEYAQKMNYAMPAYECQRQDTTQRAAYFSCTVEIGGIRYIGAVARTKKEAEIKAARTALLAIQSNPSQVGEIPNDEVRHTVVPSKRKEPETATGEQEAGKARKTVKGRFRKKPLKKRQHPGEGDQYQYRRLSPVPADLAGQSTGGPTSDGILNILMSNYIPMTMDETRTHDGQSTASHDHASPLPLEGMAFPNVGVSDCQPSPMNPTLVQDGVPSTLQDGSIPFGNGFSHSQVSECQPMAVTLNQSNEDGFPNPNSMQKSDVVECVSNSQLQSNNGGPDHSSAPLSDCSLLVSSDGFSNIQQVSESQPLFLGATGAVQIDKPNSEVSAESLVNNVDSAQKSDVVEQPEGNGDPNSQVPVVTNSEFVQKGDDEAKDSSVAVEQAGSEMDAYASKA